MQIFSGRLVFTVTVGIMIGVLSTTLNSVVAAPNKSNHKTLPVEQLQQFAKVIQHIKEYYVSETDDTELFNNAIHGMLTGLDPHSSYLDPDSYEDLRVSTSGKFGGLGIEVTMEDGFIKVISPFDDTPAMRSGIKAGDLIVRLDETPVKGLSLREAVDLMRGDKGDAIDLTIVREGESAPLTITVVRDIIKIDSVKHRMLEPGYGYLRITHFQTHTAANLRKAIKSLHKDSDTRLAGVVVDLRNNPGGVLEGAIAVSDIFLDSQNIGHNQLIVYTQGREITSRINEKARTRDMLKGIPIVILVNEGSASASEIVAGALQDHKRAIIMGNKTFGKGSVQTVLPLTEESGLKLTTAFYYTPSGRSIQAEGIVPDINVEVIEIAKKDESDDKISALIREANLTGHLENQTEDDDNGHKSTENNTQLAETDYQLNEALNLLKGLTIYAEHKSH